MTEMITAEEIVKWVEEEEKNLSALHKQMDEDFDRWNLKETIYDSHKTSINVTLSDPRLFADDVQSTMSQASMQIRVRMAEKGGEDNRDDQGKLENLLTFGFEKADELLARKLLPPFRDTAIWHGLIRACRSGRVMVFKKGSDVIFDIVNWDPRWVTYKVGANGLIKAAHKMFRPKEILLDEYGVQAEKSFLDSLKSWIPFTKPKDTVAVIDYWSIPDKDKPTEILNVVVSGNTILHQELYNLPSFPVSIRPVAVRPPIASESSLIATGHGGSIYAPNRGTYDLLNKLHSIEATRANLLAKQPVINYFKSDGVTNLKDTIMQAEAIIDVPEETNRLEEMPMKEVPVTLLDMIDKLNNMKERGEVPPVGISNPPQSGTLQGMVISAGAKIYFPQLNNLGLFYGDICKLIEEQLIAGKLKVDVETEVKRKYYRVKVTPVDLKKPHVIKVKFPSRKPWLEVETAGLADMLKRQGLPDEFVWDEVYEFQDPKGLIDLAAVEIAEHSPRLMMLKAIEKLRDLGRFEEARELMEEYMAAFGEDGQEQAPQAQLAPGQIV